MQKIAIKNTHPVLSSELINILESLGGVNILNHTGSHFYGYYYINIHLTICLNSEQNLKDYILYESIEEYEQSLLKINYTDI
jgi:hypothetical protein